MIVEDLQSRFSGIVSALSLSSLIQLTDVSVLRLNTIPLNVLIPDADGSRVSITISNHPPLCVILSVCLSVCPHDKTKTAETKIAKTWHSDSPSRYLAHQ